VIDRRSAPRSSMPHVPESPARFVTQLPKSAGPRHLCVRESR
jgi:hypothetical protein